MNVDDAEEYTQALGQVTAGSWRQILLGDRLGVPQALGLSTKEWVERRLGGYIRMSITERKEAIKELAADDLTQRKIAEVLGVGMATVNRDLKPDPPVPNGTRDVSLGGEDEVRGATSSSLVPSGTREPSKKSMSERIAALPDDLAGRVRAGSLDLAEAESVVKQREQRMTVWVDKIVSALEVLGRMAGYPIPADLQSHLSSDQLMRLQAVLEALHEGVLIA